MNAICLQLVQAAEGMSFLHSCKPAILHRDLKCSNIFVESNNEKARVRSLYYHLIRYTEKKN